MTALLQRFHLDELEAEAGHIMREVAAELERPVLLFSGGKDSIVLLHAEKASASLPLPADARRHGHNFPEVIEYRDRRVAELGERLVCLGATVDRQRPRRRADGPPRLRNQLQTTTLLDAMSRTSSTRRSAARGATRNAPRRADLLLPRRLRPVTQGPGARALELYNGKIARRAGARVPDLELDRVDVWQYVAREAGAPRSTTPTSVRCSSATDAHDLRRDRARRGRGAVHRVGSLPHRQRHDARAPCAARVSLFVVAGSASCVPA
jgi:sulfate adenylyltransferase subunit 2